MGKLLKSAPKVSENFRLPPYVQEIIKYSLSYNKLLHCPNLRREFIIWQFAETLGMVLVICLRFFLRTKTPGAHIFVSWLAIGSSLRISSTN